MRARGCVRGCAARAYRAAVCGLRLGVNCAVARRMVLRGGQGVQGPPLRPACGGAKGGVSHAGGTRRAMSWAGRRQG